MSLTRRNPTLGCCPPLSRSAGCRRSASAAPSPPSFIVPQRPVVPGAQWSRDPVVPGDDSRAIRTAPQRTPREVAVSDFRDYLQALEKAGQLVHVTKEVSLKFEIAAHVRKSS